MGSDARAGAGMTTAEKRDAIRPTPSSLLDDAEAESLLPSELIARVRDECLEQAAAVAREKRAVAQDVYDVEGQDNERYKQAVSSYLKACANVLSMAKTFALTCRAWRDAIVWRKSYFWGVYFDVKHPSLLALAYKRDVAECSVCRGSGEVRLTNADFCQLSTLGKRRLRRLVREKTSCTFCGAHCCGVCLMLDENIKSIDDTWYCAACMAENGIVRCELCEKQLWQLDNEDVDVLDADYVSLEKCPVCGNKNFCDECVVLCEECDEVICRYCSLCCDVCYTPTCQSCCKKSCAQCGVAICNTCYDGSEYCHNHNHLEIK